MKMSDIVEKKMAAAGMTRNYYGDVPVVILNSIYTDAITGTDPMIMTLANTKKRHELFRVTSGVEVMCGQFLTGVDAAQLAAPIGRFDGAVTFAAPRAWHKNWYGKWIRGARAAWCDELKTIWIYDEDGDVIDRATPEEWTREEGWMPYVDLKRRYEQEGAAAAAA
jgi:hypothetical protein